MLSEERVKESVRTSEITFLSLADFNAVRLFILVREKYFFLLLFLSFLIQSDKREIVSNILSAEERISEK